ncbi:unnamed protein product [Phytomonas sp. Hart1]|nr:unnamed protein product [Phytomonas sp. Hart1]|eukprot:CCW68563.1 unnamed protein product [Phytomonas sp. isolate Hart1]
MAESETFFSHNVLESSKPSSISRSITNCPLLSHNPSPDRTTQPQNTLPFYTVALSSAKESLVSATAVRAGRLTPSITNTKSNISPSPHALSVNAVVDTEPRKLNGEFELPGRLFGAKRTPLSAMADKISLPSTNNTQNVVTETGLATCSLSDSTRKECLPMQNITSTHIPQGMTENTTRTTSIQHKTLNDAIFFSDILFMWMGVDQTTHITYNSSMGCYEMNPNCGNEEQLQVLKLLQSCGVLARSIEESLSRTLGEQSFLQQSLRSALRRQLTQYHYLLSTIRERQTPVLTLGDLMVVHQRVYPKLWVMHHILQETECVKGGEMASVLRRRVQQGSHRLSALLRDIYTEAISPLLRMTVVCITRGEVTDPFNEFFIVSNAKINDNSDNFWTSKFSLSRNMLPVTVSRAVAEDVLLVLKNICFIYNCCRAKQWRMDPGIVAEANQVSFETLPSVVSDALTYSNAAVLRYLREEFKLDDTFRMVSAFLLVGHGGFFEILIPKLVPILSKLSHTIHVSVVRDQMSSALLEIAPYTRHLDTDRFTALHCEIIKDESKLGWDAFVITMPLSSPLSNIFDSVAAKMYRQLFRILFKVKVAEVSLKKAWRQSVIIDRAIGVLQQQGAEEMAAWCEVAADAHLLGLQLNHFVINLWSYLVSEVSMVAWDLMQKAISRCTSLDDIRVAHHAYLAYLFQRSLLHHDCASIRVNVENIITIVREYCGSQALLTSLIERGSGEVVSIKQQYQSLTDDFHREMSALLTTLEEQHLQFDFLNFLLLRLNFNRYYRNGAISTNTDF